MVLRHWYLLRSSWPRVLDLIYWPAVQMLMWGFLQTLRRRRTAGFFAQAAGTFIGAVLLWDILFRGQLGFSISFLEEMWSRNIGNLMMSPLRPVEFVAALMIMSVIRLAIGMVPVTLLAIAFFGFNLWGIGLRARGVLREPDPHELGGRHLRVGHRCCATAWAPRAWPGRFMFLLLPLTCVYYPVAVLPAWLQIGRLGAAADLRVRGHAGAADRARLPRRPDGAGLRAQRRAISAPA